MTPFVAASPHTGCVIVDVLGCRGHGGPPEAQAQEAVAIPLEDLARILVGFQGTRWFALVALGFATGLREGELLGLRWADVDWTHGVLWIRQALKTPGDAPVFGSRKQDDEYPAAVDPGVLKILREHQRWQEQERKDYTEDWGLVFTARDGSPVDASNFRDDAWRPVLATFVEPGQAIIIQKRGVHVATFGDSLRRLAWEHGVSEADLRKANPDVRLQPLTYVFHQLRHWYASYLMGGKDPLSVVAVAKAGGWSDPRTPLAHYAHAITEDDRRAATKAAEVLRRALTVGQRQSRSMVRASVRASERGRSGKLSS